MLLGDAESTECHRYRGNPELRACELEREPHDPLTAARRPPAGALGSEAIRFSTAPSLGGRAFIVEIVRDSAGRGRARIAWAFGHPAWRWKIEGTARRRLSASDYRRLTAHVDAILESDEDIRSTGDWIALCADGLQPLTERVRQGRVETLGGQCGESHPNRRIGAIMLNLACRQMRHVLPEDPKLRRNCSQWRSSARRAGFDL